MNWKPIELLHGDYICFNWNQWKKNYSQNYKKWPYSRNLKYFMGQHATQFFFSFLPFFSYEHLSIALDFKHWCYWRHFNVTSVFVHVARYFITLRKIIFSKCISITDNIYSSVEFCSVVNLSRGIWLKVRKCLNILVNVIKIYTCNFLYACKFPITSTYEKHC